AVLPVAEVPQRLGEVLGEAVGDVHPEAVHAAVGPEPQGLAEVLPDFGVVPVEVGLFRREQVQVPLAVLDSGPGRAAAVGLPVGGRLLAVLAAPLAEDVAVAGGGAARG